MTTDPMDALEAAWERSDALFALLPAGAELDRPIPLRHPFTFYIGHLPAFGWNQVARGALGRGPLDRRLDDLFARGIDPGSAADAGGMSAWPDLATTWAYRDRARAALRAAVPDVATRADDPLCRGLRVYHLVLEHELMHHETLLYMLAAQPPERLVAPADLPPHALAPVAPAVGQVGIPAGVATLGTRLEAVPFAWDNELDEHVVEIPSFSIDRFPVTVAAFRAFVEAGAYTDPGLWDAEDAAWLAASARRHPHAWFQDGDRWKHRTLFGSVRLDDVGGWPAMVTWAEARAFCRWSGARLPTEAELHRAAYGTPTGEERLYPWGCTAPAAAHGNFGAKLAGLAPVDAHPAGASAFGVHDLLGNLWEWAADDFGPFDGFRPWARTYPGYSADFFGQGHKVLFGGAWPTDPVMLRRSFRNWFRPRYPWVFAGFRRAWGGLIGHSGSSASMPSMPPPPPPAASPHVTPRPAGSAAAPPAHETLQSTSSSQLATAQASVGHATSQLNASAQSTAQTEAWAQDTLQVAASWQSTVQSEPALQVTSQVSAPAGHWKSQPSPAAHTQSAQVVAPDESVKSDRVPPVQPAARARARSHWRIFASRGAREAPARGEHSQPGPVADDGEGGMG
jgi:ergothioneine biosynthesis protein EgtB